MKSTIKYLVIILIMAFGRNLSAQEVWVANNNFNAPTGPNVFSTIQAAVNAASAGDIVQVQPSPNVYGNVSINKQITLMGIGFNVDKDIPLISNMGSIALTNNVDNTSDSDGTIIKGLQFTILYMGNNTGPSFVLENILVQNCYISYIYTTNSGYSPIDGFELRDSYLTASTSGFAMLYYMPTTNVIIRNNLILNNIAFLSNTPGSNIVTNNILYAGVRVDVQGSNTTILNNDFIGASGSETAFSSNLRDCIVANNIFYGSTPSISVGGSSSVNFQRNVFTNNLVYATGNNNIPPSGGGAGNSGSGNLDVGSPEFEFVELLDTWSSTYDFRLKTSPVSPATNAGSDGTDIGITGGSYPFPTDNFILKTTPAPVIQILNTSTVINPNTDLPVRIKANSN